ncbi:hypothetical protein GGR58DRAFT_246506 [Xylaria digitata]|nr:hypothetical protein GGR58DRAFT_246506 [Xylaria digitata]
MTDSTQMQVGSSSPIQLSSQVSSRDDAFVPDDPDSLAREANTERLLTCFLRCILYSIPYLELDLEDRLECRAPLAAAVFMSGGWSIRAEDDGGLRRRPALVTIEHDVYYIRSRLVDCYHVLFEAKKRFWHIHNGRPTVSDNWLGQMTAEALVGRLARTGTYHGSRIFIIAAARHILCFLKFDISNEYLEDIQTEEPTLILPVSCTRWLDLNDYTERRYAAENIARLIQISD